MRRQWTLRPIFVAIIMLSASTAVGPRAEAQTRAQTQPGYGYVQAPLGYRQPTPDDLSAANEVQLDKQRVENDNALLDLSPTQQDVTGADQVESEENALAKRIERENAQLDHELRGICRGC